MWAIALDYRADRCVLASVSAVYDDGAVHHGYGAKLHTFPKIRSGFFARGKSGISLRVEKSLLTKPTLHCWEDAVDVLPEFIATASRDFYKEAGIQHPDEGSRWYEGLLCGSSHTEGRMRLAVFGSFDGFQAHSRA